MKDTLELLNHLVEEFSTFENYISHLKQVREINTKIIREEENYCKEAWDKVSQTDGILENLDILLEKVKLEDVQEAARTFKRYENQ